MLTAIMARITLKGRMARPDFISLWYMQKNGMKQPSLIPIMMVIPLPVLKNIGATSLKDCFLPLTLISILPAILWFGQARQACFSGLFGNLVKLEDPRFSQQFKVYSSDQVEARYLLTPRMTERLVDLKDSLGSIEISFIGSWVNIAAGGFPYNAFEPDLKQPFTDPVQVERTLGWIFRVVGIVEELDLNTRIWTK
ncbi:DUF3137 domain-containing protein [Trichlorobacter lovleyi]|uniref:DUF3137 domain-containing protein n=1 Tax=Trichlorobacter lovleyi TaxID=313985 RepID=UPI003D0EB7AC